MKIKKTKKQKEIDLSRPLNNLELNRKRNIVMAIDNLITQIGEPIHWLEESLFFNLVDMRESYLENLNQKRRKK